MLLVIDLLLAAGLSWLWCFLSPLRGVWAGLLFVGSLVLTALLLVVLYLFTLYIISFFLKTDPANRKKHPVMMFFLIKTMRAICLGGQIRLRVTGREKLPNEPFLLVENHRSMMDMVVTVAAFPKHPLAFVAKPEILRFPMIGKVAMYCNYLAIDRTNPRNAIRTVGDAAGILRNGISNVCVYPEGTRNRERQTELLPFHDGVLMIAQKAKAPIVVVSLNGTEKISKRAPWRRSRVDIHVCDVIGAEEACALRTGELSARIRKALEEDLQGAKSNA